MNWTRKHLLDIESLNADEIRIILDATTPYEWTERPREVFMDADTLTKVSARWNEYGFEGASPIDGMMESLSRDYDKSN